MERLDLAGLAGARPTATVRRVLDRIAAAGADGVWITRVPDAHLLAEAARLEDEGPQGRPLWGVPFAVKDNIDAAGLPTTAACPEFAYAPAQSAPAVERLLAAGAILVGKTNLDQFATGLVGVRSPYGVPRNPFNAEYIPGGSSSGSAVAVASGLVAFALGTDTAGSGRVPAAFNDIVGLKPTRGLVSTRGVVPACRSLDCVSVFATSVADASRVLDAIAGYDAEDAFSRAAPPGFASRSAAPPRFIFGVPGAEQLRFFGNDEGASLFAAAAARLEALGGERREVDFAPFAEAATLLYDGPWVAERTAAIEEFLRHAPSALHPVTRRITEGGLGRSAIEAFRAMYRLEALRQATRATWAAIEVLLVPTAPRCYRIAEIEADPIELNSRLGTYTNFTNLLDLCAVAVPAGFQRDGLPFGVTLLAPAFQDGLVAGIAGALDGATPAGSSYPYLPVAVVGAHLSGEPLNDELVRLGARLREATRTAPSYRLYALPDGRRPGLVRSLEAGAAIEIEVWDVPLEAVGAFLAGIAPPLGLGSVELADGKRVTGFLCESAGLDEAQDITRFGGWRAWRQLPRN